MRVFFRPKNSTAGPPVRLLTRAPIGRRLLIQDASLFVKFRSRIIVDSAGDEYADAYPTRMSSHETIPVASSWGTMLFFRSFFVTRTLGASSSSAGISWGALSWGWSSNNPLISLSQFEALIWLHWFFQSSSEDAGQLSFDHHRWSHPLQQMSPVIKEIKPESDNYFSYSKVQNLTDYFWQSQFNLLDFLSHETRIHKHDKTKTLNKILFSDIL